MPATPDAGAVTHPHVPSLGGAAVPSGEGLTAVLVAHGMGQQVPYQTLGMVVDAMERAPGASWKVMDRRMGLVRVGTEDLRRIELTLARTGGGDEDAVAARRVHVYEAYWAPLTEGKVRLLDVVAFLATAALSGLRVGGGVQKRWLFGAWRDFPPVPGATIALAMGLLTLAGLALMNVAAFLLVGLAQMPDAVLRLPRENVDALKAELTTGLMAFLLVAGLLGAWSLAVARAVRTARIDGDASGLARLTDAGMGTVAWGLAGAMGFLVASLAVAGAYATCIATPDCAPSLGVREAALAATAALLLAVLLLPRHPATLGAGALLALLAAAAGRFWAPLSAPVIPVALAGLALLVALLQTAVGLARPPGGRSARWYHYAFFATSLLALVALAGGLALAPALPVPRGDLGLLLGAAALVTLSALAGMIVGAAATGTWAWSARGAKAVATALLLSVPVVLLVLGLATLPPGPRTIVAWGLVAAVAVVVGRLVTQYVGDVAAYVSPHKLDRFAQLREDIKARVKRVADAVYGMRTPDGTRLAYDRVLLVGHSLGSVVTYDTLNALLLDDLHAVPRAPRPDDRACDHPRAVAERTRLLVTFGSPLDRTAFVFATQRDETAAGPAMASFAQPLLAWPPAREALAWVNVHSRADIISSELTYYDVPRDPRSPGRVENVEDDLAATPLLAHNEYWRNAAAWTRVVDAIFAPA